jgi:tRNA A37 threonylcarbamoyladenosine biosynthesis protein TsaE
LFAWALLVDNVKVEPITHFSMYKHQKLDSLYCPGNKESLERKQFAPIVEWAKTEIQKDISIGLVSIGLKRQQ